MLLGTVSENRESWPVVGSVADVGVGVVPAVGAAVRSDIGDDVGAVVGASATAPESVPYFQLFVATSEVPLSGQPLHGTCSH